MSVHTIHETNSLDVAVTVTRSGDLSPLDLSSATLTAKAKCKGGEVEGTAAMEDALAGAALASFPPGSFDGFPGAWEVQLEAAIGADVQTVLALPFLVKRSQ